MADLRSQNIAGENERENLQDDKRWLGYKIGEAEAHAFRLEKEVKDKNEIDKLTAELVAERDKLKEELTTAQNKLDGMYSENAKLVTQKLAEVNRVYDKVRAIEAEHEATKKQLLAQQQEVKRLKVDNERLKEEIKEIEAKSMEENQELSELVSGLANPLEELKKELGLENKILVLTK